MITDQFVSTAASLQREGKNTPEVEAALAEMARREAPDCQMRRDFAGHAEFIFPDGQCLRFDGRSWNVQQQARLAPLYEAVIAPFGDATLPAGGMRTA